MPETVQILCPSCCSLFSLDSREETGRGVVGEDLRAHPRVQTLRVCQNPTSDTYTGSGWPKSSASAGSCVMATRTWWSNNHLAIGTPRTQTWRATASSFINSVDTLKGASFSTCHRLTTSKQIPWHELAPPDKPYQRASPFSASSNRLSSRLQNQTPSSCRLTLMQPDTT